MRSMQGKSKYTRILIAVLLACGMLLTAGCTEKPAEPTQTTADTAQKPTPSETVIVPDTTAATEATESHSDASLTSLRQAMIETPQLFAVAYFGYHDNMDSNLPVDPFAAMQAYAPGLCADLPFLLEIPEERIIGKSGELFCIVPLDAEAQVAVSLAGWDAGNEDFVYEESLYLSDSGEPILIFCSNAWLEPDIQVQISGPSGDAVWYPQLDDDQRVMPLWNDDWENSIFDFSAYREILTAEYRRMQEDADWNGIIPTEEMLVGSTWVWYGQLRDGREVNYRMIFEAGVLSVFWNDGINPADQEYLYAPWKLTCEDDFAVLSVDFEGFAGVRRYNLLYSELFDVLYVGMDVLQDEMPFGWEPLYRFMPRPAAPEPVEMMGTWERAWTEVEGDRNEAIPGRQIIEITMNEEGQYRITYTDHDFPGYSYSDKAVQIIYEAIYPGCGNERWSAVVDYVDSMGTEFTFTVLDDETLLLQNYWVMDGSPWVSYEWYRRVY